MTYENLGKRIMVGFGRRRFILRLYSKHSGHMKSWFNLEIDLDHRPYAEREYD